MKNERNKFISKIIKLKTNQNRWKWTLPVSGGIWGENGVNVGKKKRPFGSLTVQDWLDDDSRAAGCCRCWSQGEVYLVIGALHVVLEKKSTSTGYGCSTIGNDEASMRIRSGPHSPISTALGEVTLTPAAGDDIKSLEKKKENTWKRSS